MWSTRHTRSATRWPRRHRPTWRCSPTPWTGSRPRAPGCSTSSSSAGGKSYGEHLGPYKTPAKESDPRFLGPIFYNDQADLLADRAAGSGFTFTVLRPDLIIGFSLGAPMNLLAAIGVYAALCKEQGVPLRFPGAPLTWSALQQFTDADLLAAAVQWALTAQSARGEVFNVINGDQFRWQHLWEDCAAVFEMRTAPPQPMKLGEQTAGKEPAWEALIARHRLKPTQYRQIASWDFPDAVLWSPCDLVQSTIKKEFQPTVVRPTLSHHSTSV